ncbi:MAG: hypothetical protein US60_C0051G0005 [Microgenomates group bacterium GW2011_GWC1_37_8]|nr:MAG: hypothetical protein US60_C0051G0005 [Microgenomates group bacterium GW2011_GWC1_37_8]
MKNRTELAKYFKELGFMVGAEIGVAQGYFSRTICEENPGVKLYCIDPWEVYGEYRDFAKKDTFETMYNTAKEILAPYDCTFIKKFSMDAVKDFDDGALDFVFIDGNHQYKYVKEDIEMWTPKVRVGGIVSLHDYYKTKAGNVGVIRAVDEYVKEYGYKLKIIDWDKDNPVRDDRQPCAYFLKSH